MSSRKRSSSVPGRAHLGQQEPALGAPRGQDGNRARVGIAAGEPVAARRPIVLDRPAQRGREPGEDHGVDRRVPAVHRREAEAERGCGLGYELGRRPRGKDTSAVDDDHLIGQALDVGELVGRRGGWFDQRPAGRR